MVFCGILATIVAGLSFVLTQGDASGDRSRPDSQAGNLVNSSPAPAPSTLAAGSPSPAISTPADPPAEPEAKPAVEKRTVFVEVYNNSGITGLATEAAQTAGGAGWNVVGSDNWYGTIPASTVYYPPRLAVAAKALGRDLGIGRLQPAVDPMRFDRLTVILTADYS
jgi:hypothetical protein